MYVCMYVLRLRFRQPEFIRFVWPGESIRLDFPVTNFCQSHLHLTHLFCCEVRRRTMPWHGAVSPGLRTSWIGQHSSVYTARLSVRDIRAINSDSALLTIVRVYRLYLLTYYNYYIYDSGYYTRTAYCRNNATERLAYILRII